MLYATPSEGREEAYRTLNKVARLDPLCGEASEILAREVAFFDEDAQKAIRIFKKACTAYEQAGNAQKATEMRNEAATLINDEGWSALSQNDFASAKKRAMKALELYSHHVDARNVLGNLHLKKSEYKYAEIEFRQGMESAIAEQGGKAKLEDVSCWLELETRPYIRAIHGLALSLIHLQDYREALNLVRLMLDLDPEDHIGVSYLLGDLRFFLNELPEAAEMYEKYRESNGSFNHALLLHATGKSKKEESLIVKSIEEHPLQAIFLHKYLFQFLWWKNKNIYKWGDLPGQRMHISAFNLAWKEFIPSTEEADIREIYLFEGAAAFVELSGPLWLTQKESLTFLETGIAKADPKDAEGSVILGAYGLIMGEDYEKMRRGR